LKDSAAATIAVTRPIPTAADNGIVHVQLNASVQEINNEQEQVNGI
jgi:hypothetical protein